MKLAFVLLVAALAIAEAGRTFNRCSLIREMNSMGVPRNQLDKWACIAEHESSFRTWVVGPPAPWDGSRDYGLFQINDLYWCKANGQFSYNGCHVNCNDLLSDDISRVMRCAQQVQREQGWSAWAVWPKCSGWLPSIDSCF